MVMVPVAGGTTPVTTGQFIQSGGCNPDL